MKKVYLIRYFFTVLFFSPFISAYSQEIKTTQSSAIKGQLVYFVNGKYADSISVRKILPDSILSVKTIKRDTLINSKKFDTQIFVTLKKNTSQLAN